MSTIFFYYAPALGVSYNYKTGMTNQHLIIT